jgi:hypothetical protein
MPPGLLAVADDIDAGVFLIGDDEADGVAWPPRLVTFSNHGAQS